MNYIVGSTRFCKNKYTHTHTHTHARTKHQHERLSRARGREREREREGPTTEEQHRAFSLSHVAVILRSTIELSTTELVRYACTRPRLSGPAAIRLVTPTVKRSSSAPCIVIVGECISASRDERFCVCNQFASISLLFNG